MTAGARVDGPGSSPVARLHLGRITEALGKLDIARIEEWSRGLALLLPIGRRLLIAGNGGLAAEAQHLTAELVGRFGDERRPLSAPALHGDTSTVTAVGNNYGFDDVFARQVHTHGRRGDVPLALSVSGRSPDVRKAAAAAHSCGMLTWALTGPITNPLAETCHEVVGVPALAATVQEVDLVAVHLVCAAVDAALAGPASGLAVPAVIARSGGTAMVPAGAARRHRETPGPLVVVGDTLLDRDRSGSANRLSPEAPVPVLAGITHSARPGGAGLAALLGARAGNTVTLVTALSADADGAELRAMLTEAGVRILDMGLDGATPVKTRIRAGSRTLLMLDEADPAPGGIGGLPDVVRDALASASGVLVSDYGRGVAADAAVREALAATAPSTPVVWDPHPRGAAPVRGTCLATPNSREAAGAVQGAAGSLAADVANGRALMDRWPVSQLAVTRGGMGAVLLQDKDAVPMLMSAPAVPAPDTCGAGDQFAVAATSLLASGALPSEAVVAAVAIASSYVAAGGPSSLSIPHGRLGPEGGRPDAVELASRVRASNGTVVVAGGCFDLLHTGHIHLLDAASKLGDCLVVCLNSDASVARFKGHGRPVVSAADRQVTLLALRSVDAVLVFEDDTPEAALELLRPDIFVKGGDYSMADIPETEVLRRWGGQVVVVPYLAGRSTTAMIQVARDAP